MRSEYDPLIPDPSGAGSDDLERVQELFADASRPYLSSPWPWLAWALLLPAAALATRGVAALAGVAGVMALWSIAVLAGGLLEAATFLRQRRGRSGLASWALSSQGNLSLVAVALSLLLLWLDHPQAIPGVWLLLLGHSLFSLGSLASSAQRRAGLVYQLGGIVALLHHGRSLEVLAVATAAANLSIAWALWRAPREDA